MDPRVHHDLGLRVMQISPLKSFATAALLVVQVDH
jgi:hypothetical protein